MTFKYNNESIAEFDHFIEKLKEIGNVQSPTLQMLEYLKLTNYFADIKARAYEEGFNDGLKKWEEPKGGKE